MMRGARHALPHLGGDLLHGALALSEHVDDLGAAPTPQRGRYGRKRIEQGTLGRSATHIFKLTFEQLLCQG
jgi:hypothetical protein